MEARVLVVDADADARSRVVGTLADAGIGVVGDVGSIDDAVAAVAATRPNAVFLDVATVGNDGSDAAVQLRAVADGRLAVIAMANEADVERVSELVAAGALAYVVKERDLELVGAVRAVLSGSSLLAPEATRPVVEEVARLYERERVRNNELQELVKQLQALSVTDWLTGLKNHGYFFERLIEELDRAIRHRRPLALLLGDLDDFKQVNDSKGHAAGDRVLQTVGDVMREELRSADIVCRLGGEEFAVLLPETDAKGAFLVAERIRESLAASVIPGVGTVTISIGVAGVPENATETDDLMESADRALYLAKREGKNRTRLAGQIVPLQAPPIARPLRGEIVELLVRVLRLRDPHLAEHALRTAEVAVAIAAHMSFPAAELEHLRVAALLQDVGKIGVPDSILFKKGPLSSEEWERIKEHPEKGFDIVGTFVHPDAAEAVLANHERFDGTGYPRGLKGHQIPELARVLLVADAYAAMTAQRAFKAPLGASEALAEISQHAGSQFDPDVVAAVVSLGAALTAEESAGRVVEHPPDSARAG